MVGTLLAAVASGGRLAGYVLYDLPRDEVRLIHLCVDEAFRGRSVARMLIDEIPERHRDRRAIVLRCRRDFEANKVWPRLGFAQVGEVTGRSKAGHPLNVWRRWLGQPDLFTWAAETGPTSFTTAAIDVNIFSDLHSSHERPDESDALVADWIAPEIELVVTEALGAEVDKSEDGPDRRRLKRAMHTYRWLHPPPSTWRPIYDELRSIVDEIDDATDFDLQHLAMTAAAGVRYFVTRDKTLTCQFGEHIREAHGVRVLTPTDLVLVVDQRLRAGEYQPVQLHGTAYAWTRIREGEIPELVGRFLNREAGERRRSFYQRLRRYVADPGTYRVRVLRNPDGEPVALEAGCSAGDIRRIKVLRLEAPGVGPTLARQILFLARQDARAEEASRVVIDDTRVSAVIRAAFSAEAYYPVGSTWHAMLVDERLMTEELSDRIAAWPPESVEVKVRELADQIQPRTVLDRAAAAEVEARLWPVKVVDADLPTYVVPIRPAYATDLFNLPLGAASLFARSDELGIAREHIYYRSPGAARGIASPARILWYVTEARATSGARRGDTRAVWACSALLGVVCDQPEVAFHRFQHLGVYTRRQVSDAAGRTGEVMALRFANTEIFARPVSLDEARQLARDHGHTLSLQSPCRVSPEFFVDVYERGFRRESE